MRLPPSGLPPTASGESACTWGSMRLSGLRHHFGGKVVRALLQALADDEEGVRVDPGLLRAKHLLDGLLVVLDERLSHERDLAEELVQRALDHLDDDLGRLARFLGARLVDFPF